VHAGSRGIDGLQFKGGKTPRSIRVKPFPPPTLYLPAPVHRCAVFPFRTPVKIMLYDFWKPAAPALSRRFSRRERERAILR